MQQQEAELQRERAPGLRAVRGNGPGAPARRGKGGVMAGPHGGTYDGGRAMERLRDRRLALAIRDGWHVRYDGSRDQFVASRDEVAAHSLDELLVEMLRAQRADPDDGDEDPARED